MLGVFFFFLPFLFNACRRTYVNVLEWGCSPFVTSRPTIRTNRCSYSYPKVRSIPFWSVPHGTASRFSWMCLPLCLCEVDPPLTLLASDSLWAVLRPYFFGGTWEPQLMHRFTEITSAIPLPSIQKGEKPLNKKAKWGLFFIYYISPKVGSPESRTQQSSLLRDASKKTDAARKGNSVLSPLLSYGSHHSINRGKRGTPN